MRSVLMNSSFSLINLLSLLSIASAVSIFPKLLVVSFDGFRHDFLSYNLTPNLQKLLLKSAYAARMINIFPTQTFPNHFSIATGLYAEHHGVLATHVFDSSSQKELTYGYELFHYNKTVTPIWTLNEMVHRERHSGTMMWAGSDFEYRGVKSTFAQTFNTSIPWNERVDRVLKWFLHEKTPANFVALYFESPDYEEHAFGPDSEQVRKQITRVDNTVRYILDSLNDKGLTDLNVIFLSDHGMETFTLDRVIDLSPIIDPYGSCYGTSPVLQIYPNEGKLTQLFNALSKKAKESGNFQVFRKEDIPPQLRYKDCIRAPPILAIAKPKYGFQDLYLEAKEMSVVFNFTYTNTTPFGIHGYDPAITTMQPFLIAYGPQFKRGYRTDVVNLIDLYSLFSEVLNIDLAAVKYSTDGHLNQLSKMLKRNNVEERSSIPLMVLEVILFSTLVVLLVGGIFGLRLNIPHNYENDYDYLWCFSKSMKGPTDVEYGALNTEETGESLDEDDDEEEAFHEH